MVLRKGDTNLARRAVLLAVAYVVVTAGLLAALLLQVRNETIAAGKRELAAFAQLTAGHTFEVAISIEEALKFSEETLSVATESGVVDQESIRAMLREVAANARGLKDILVLDANGKVVYQGTGTDSVGLDRSDQPYFLQYQKDPALKFDVNVPARRRTEAGSSEWFIPVTHAWRRSGQLAGVIVGIMDPQIFDKAWTFDAEIEGLGIALATTDGILIMRRPFVGEMMGRSVVVPGALTSPADALQVKSPFDGEEQLLAYRRVAGYPNLLTLVSQPMNVVLASWLRLVWTVGSCWLLASLALGGLGLWLGAVRKARGALEGRYHALFDSIPYPVIVSDNETLRVLAVNRAAEEQYGWAQTGVAADAPHLPKDFAALASKRAEFSKDKAVLLQDQRHLDRNGAVIDVELTVRLIDYDGRPAALTIAVDVTERLRAERAHRASEEQLRQSQKMDVLGQLTGGIAHDFNNMLMVIMTNVDALAENKTLDPEALKQVDRIAQSTQRAEELTRQMLAFSRKQPLRPRPTNVNDLVAETGKLLRRTLGGQIEIESILADDVWPVDIDRAQLETSLVNLCLNARDAMPTGGRVLIETQNVSIDKTQVGLLSDLSAGSFVQITVSDTGRGILASDLDRIFEPFFTTKASGKGSGLGLSMVYGFIKQSNGHISVTSDVDHGTIFRLLLPRFAGPVPETTARSSAPAIGGTERILIVEDNPQVRASVVRQAQSLGYAVTEAEDGSAGLAACEAEPRPYDLMLTDVVMPGAMNGKALADAVAARWPATRIVFMSGYTDNVLGNRGEVDGDVRLLSKPFRKSDLAQMIRQTLDKK